MSQKPKQEVDLGAEASQRGHEADDFAAESFQVIIESMNNGLPSESVGQAYLAAKQAGKNYKDHAARLRSGGARVSTQSQETTDFLMEFAEEESAQGNTERLIKAAQDGDIEMVRVLLAKEVAPPFVNGASNVNGYTALVAAAQHAHLGIVQCLLAAKANSNVAVHYGKKSVRKTTPLISAVRATQANTLPMLKALLTAKAEIDATSTSGNTALFEAVGLRQLASVKLLLAHKADPTKSCKDGRSPIELAQAAGLSEIGGVLLGCGAAAHLAAAEAPAAK